MCQRSIFARSCSRIAEEVQLQAEEEWIVDALKKIKQQRNCLQIERLHLESLKAQLTEPVSSKVEEKEESNQHVSAVTMMQPALSSMRNQDWDTNDEDVLCNNQELDLMVTNPVFEMHQQQEKQGEFDVEEDDDDNDEEDDDDDNVMIDMNMLMNGSSEMCL